MKSLLYTNRKIWKHSVNYNSYLFKYPEIKLTVGSNREKYIYLISEKMLTVARTSEILSYDEFYICTKYQHVHF